MDGWTEFFDRVRVAILDYKLNVLIYMCKMHLYLYADLPSISICRSPSVSKSLLLGWIVSTHMH